MRFTIKIDSKIVNMLIVSIVLVIPFAVSYSMNLDNNVGVFKGFNFIYLLFIWDRNEFTLITLLFNLKYKYFYRRILGITMIMKHWILTINLGEFIH